MSKSKLFKWCGVVGFLLILLISATVIATIILSGTRSIDNTQGLLTAFAGAFFAYVLIKIGELFTRMSLREKLNLDTLVEIEYLLNDHLNKITLNVKIIDALTHAIDDQSPSVNFMLFKPIAHTRPKIQDLKNIDFINELFNYFVDIEKINDGMGVIQTFAQNLVNSVARGDLTVAQHMSIQAAYAANAMELKGMMEDTKKLLIAAEKDCEELLAKNQYVGERRNHWLYLAIPWFNTTHYDKDELKEELPKILKRIQKDRDEVTRSSVKQVTQTLGKKKTSKDKA